MSTLWTRSYSKPWWGINSELPPNNQSFSFDSWCILGSTLLARERARESAHRGCNPSREWTVPIPSCERDNGLERPRTNSMRGCPRFSEICSIGKTRRAEVGAPEFVLKCVKYEWHKTPVSRVRELIFGKHSQAEVLKGCTGGGMYQNYPSGLTHSPRAV